MKKIILTTAILTTALFAQSIEVKHNCYKPERPVTIKSEVNLNNYNIFVSIYQECMQKFIDKQGEKTQVLLEEVDKREKARASAILEYNTFIDELERANAEAK